MADRWAWLIDVLVQTIYDCFLLRSFSNFLVLHGECTFLAWRIFILCAQSKMALLLHGHLDKCLMAYHLTKIHFSVKWTSSWGIIFSQIMPLASGIWLFVFSLLDIPCRCLSWGLGYHQVGVSLFSIEELDDGILWMHNCVFKIKKYQ